MQNFLGSLRSPALFNIILNITLLENLENNTCSYFLSSFYMVATREGNLHENARFLDPKIAKLQELSQTPRQISPPLTPKPGSAPGN